ncbi:hypothetical protein GCM10022277_41710 [Litoribacillus peritrichatus]|uniref:Transposase n=1 Tax=Litoribacillus peritrichatus TaxID=718191 RepID=A0ABP7NAK5_9GAMM
MPSFRHPKSSDKPTDWEVLANGQKINSAENQVINLKGLLKSRRFITSPWIERNKMASAFLVFRRYKVLHDLQKSLKIETIGKSIKRPTFN